MDVRNESSYLPDTRRANQTRDEFFSYSKSSVGNSVYTNRERVINEKTTRQEG